MAQVLVLGGGGREHALAWALQRSPQVTRVYTAPGNAGTPNNVPITLDRVADLIAFVKKNAIDLTVVGPEVPLAEGVVDAFQAEGLLIFGPRKAAAQLEASKSFARDFMMEQGIPAPEYMIFDDMVAARRYLKEYQKPVVIKADGLAAGKGVIVCDNRAEAEDALTQIMQDRAFGDAGAVVVIEERLQGREFSVLALCDGKTIQPLLVARDHKRLHDGDRGPNTGGMGAICPTPDWTEERMEEVMQRVLIPAVRGMANLGTPYVGVLYAGMMDTPDGLKTLEFNCRFGDPEAQVILPLLKTDLYMTLQACCEGWLHDLDLEWHEGACATVVMATAGYPENPITGTPISGLDRVPEDVIVFHASTTQRDDQVVTNGGRVLNVTASANTLSEAIQRAYAGVDKIHFEGAQFRRDIGQIAQGDA
jgi:phosphoribosylamine---glycine ligase